MSTINATSGTPHSTAPAPPATTTHGVVVLGVYRSGTSLVSRIVDRLGVDFGPRDALGSADEFNPTGYFERPDLNHLNGRLLETAGRTFAAPGRPETLAAEADPAVFGETDLGWMGETERWGMKDPRLCATLRAWVDLGQIDPHTLKLVHVTRAPEAVASSAMKYPGVNHHYGHNLDRIRRGVAEYAELALWHVQTLDVPTFALSYEQLLENPRDTIAALARFLGVEDPAAIRDAGRCIGKQKARARLLLERVARRLRRTVGLG